MRASASATYTPADVERIAKQLGGACKCGRGWDCRCPCTGHRDRKASLSVSLGDGGKLLWRCHAGCGQSEVLEGLRRAGVLLNGDARGTKADPGRGSRSR